MSTARKRVALYGGSFNPPHMGHVLIATWAVTAQGDGRLRFDETRLVPTLGHPFAKELAPFATRVAMVEDAVGHLGPRVKVDPIEGRLPAPSYTIDTINALLAAEPELELTWLMGADAWRDRMKWKAWDELWALLEGRVLVVGRGEDLPSDAPAAGFALPPFSSTAVREAVRAGKPYDWMVPEGVAAIIARDGLYRAGAGTP